MLRVSDFTASTALLVSTTSTVALAATPDASAGVDEVKVVVDVVVVTDAVVAFTFLTCGKGSCGVKRDEVVVSLEVAAVATTPNPRRIESRTFSTRSEASTVICSVTKKFKRFPDEEEADFDFVGAGKSSFST